MAPKQSVKINSRYLLPLVQSICCSGHKQYSLWWRSKAALKNLLFHAKMFTKAVILADWKEAIQAMDFNLTLWDETSKAPGHPEQNNSFPVDIFMHWSVQWWKSRWTCQKGTRMQITTHLKPHLCRKIEEIKKIFQMENTKCWPLNLWFYQKVGLLSKYFSTKDQIINYKLNSGKNLWEETQKN